jgi:aspartate/methionine/tyrosine aminotransferase
MKDPRSLNTIALMEARTRHDALQASRAGLRDLVDLNRGHTGFITPAHIREAAKRAIDEGHTHYEDVLPLREAIADKLRRENGLPSLDPRQEIVVGGGAHLVLFDIMQAFVGPGDEVICARPGSPTYFYYNTVLNGGTPVFVRLRPERRFKLDPADVEAAITPRTKIIGVTTPDTPAGAVQERADLAAIADLAIRHDLLVVSDELYEKINFGPAPHVSIASLPGMAQRTITVNGFSKCYAMTGWRVGYAAGPARLMQAVAAVHATNCIWLNTPAQYAALAAITGPQDVVREMVEEYRRRMTILLDGLTAIDGVECGFPEGGYYGWVDVTAFGVPASEFARTCLTAEHVIVGPGETFGPGVEGYLRVSCSATEDELREGLRRLARACAKIRETAVGRPR